MFTGIIQDIGQVLQIRRIGQQLLLTIRSAFDDYQQGESIAVNGCCLTVSKFFDKWFETYASVETFNKTNLKYLTPGKPVNLERALKLGDRLGGHIVTGHIDEVGKIKSIRPSGLSKTVAIEISKKNVGNITIKGSLALDGISLTVNNCRGSLCLMNVIPETFKNTIAKNWRCGSLVNVEFDQLLKFVMEQK